MSLDENCPQLAGLVEGSAWVGAAAVVAFVPESSFTGDVLSFFRVRSSFSTLFSSID